jgi:hypothetical protein
MNYDQFCMSNESCIKERALRCMQFSCKCTSDYHWSSDSCVRSSKEGLNHVVGLSYGDFILQPVNGKS